MHLEAASKDCSNSEESSTQFKQLRNVACGFLAVWALSSVSPVIAAGQVGPNAFLQCVLVYI